MKEPSLNSKIIALGVSKSWASEIISGSREPGLKLAIKIYRSTGQKYGPVASATDDEIAALEKLLLSDGASLLRSQAEHPARNPRKAAAR